MSALEARSKKKKMKQETQRKGGREGEKKRRESIVGIRPNNSVFLSSVLV